MAGSEKGQQAGTTGLPVPPRPTNVLVIYYGDAAVANAVHRPTGVSVWAKTSSTCANGAPAAVRIVDLLRGGRFDGAQRGDGGSATITRGAPPSRSRWRLKLAVMVVDLDYSASS